MTQQLVLRCRQANCNLPFAYISNGALVIQSRHGGKPHLNVMSISQLLAYLLATRAYKDGDMEAAIERIGMGPGDAAEIIRGDIEVFLNGNTDQLRVILDRLENRIE